MPRAETYQWEFKPRFRRRAFGWRSQPAIARVKQAVLEIKRIAKKDPLLAADGAVVFLERLSPALEQVDSSSGAIGTAVNNAIAQLVPIIANAPAEAKKREGWLERLFDAYQADEIPYIEVLGDSWGELCSSVQLASAWGDRLIGTTRMALSPDKTLRGHFQGTSACLSALHLAGRFDEILDLVQADVIWPYKRWAIKALASQGRKAEAIRYAETCRNPWASDREIDSMCEEILLSSGLHEEAYARYGLRATGGTTYLAIFRAVSLKYPQKSAGEILADLVKERPGDEGKWFAAAKDAGLYDNAIALAALTPCDPRTLTRAARDYAEKQPAFAVDAGLLALHWLVNDYGYEITSLDVWDAYRSTLAAAERQGSTAETRERIRGIVAAEGAGERFVTKVLGRELGF